MTTRVDLSGKPPRRFRILLAFPPSLSRKLLEGHFHQHEPIIHLAHTRQETVEAVRDRDYDVVLMGVSYPISDTREVTQRIRALPDPKCSITIIGITDMMGAPEACVAAGMDYTVSSSLLDRRILQTLIDARERRPE